MFILPIEKYWYLSFNMPISFDRCQFRVWLLFWEIAFLGALPVAENRQLTSTVLVMPWLSSAQLSSAKHSLTKIGQAELSHSQISRLKLSWAGSSRSNMDNCLYIVMVLSDWLPFSATTTTYTCHNTIQAVGARILIHNQLNLLSNRNTTNIEYLSRDTNEKNGLKRDQPSWYLRSTPASPAHNQGQLKTSDSNST